MSLSCMCDCSMQGNNEDSLALCKAVLQLLQWLLNLIYKFLQELKVTKLNIDLLNAVEKSAEIIKTILDDKACRALLFVARLESAGDTTYEPVKVCIFYHAVMLL